jgi:hypothetical protein
VKNQLRECWQEALFQVYAHHGDIEKSYIEVGRRCGFSPEYSRFCRRIKELLKVYPTINEYYKAFVPKEQKMIVEEAMQELATEKQRSNDDAS